MIPEDFTHLMKRFGTIGWITKSISIEHSGRGRDQSQTVYTALGIERLKAIAAIVAELEQAGKINASEFAELLLLVKKIGSVLPGRE